MNSDRLSESQTRGAPGSTSLCYRGNPDREGAHRSQAPGPLNSFFHPDSPRGDDACAGIGRTSGNRRSVLGPCRVINFLSFPPDRFQSTQMDFVRLSLQYLQCFIPFDPSKPSLWISMTSIALSPAVWNIVARNEYRNHTLTRKVFGGNAGAACYFLAAVIFSFGMLRDVLYRHALLQQPHELLLPQPWNTLVGGALIIGGQALVMSSTWQLGITGTYMGDYFGILKDSRVEGFPFNILRDPMYVGSTICFTGGAFWGERPIGLLVSLWVYLVYAIALQFEGPFTDMIYSTRAKLQAPEYYADDAEVKKRL